MDRDIAAVAERQHGVVTLAQLFEIGLSKQEVEYRARVGRLHRIAHGVYAVGHRKLTDRSWYRAATLSVGEGAALSGLPATALHAVLPGWVDVGPLEVTAPRVTRHRDGIRTRCMLSPAPQ